MKHTRKKIYAVLLSALLALSLLTGCGGGNSGGDVRGNSSGEDVDESPSVEEVEESQSGEEADESPSGGEVRRNQPGGPSELAPAPVIGLTSYSDSHYDDDLGELLNDMETKLPCVDAETRENYPQLADALDSFREDACNEAMESYQEREETLPDFLEMRDGDEDDEDDGNSNYLYGSTYTLVRRADQKAVSVVTVFSEYAGGAHVNYSYSAANFDAETGEEITLENLLIDGDAEALNERIGEKLDELYPDLAPGEEVAEYELEDYTFSLDPDGVTFWFDPGEIAGVGVGLLTVKLYFMLDEDILDDTYDSASSSWFVPLVEGVYQFIDAAGSVESVDVVSMLNKLEEEEDLYGVEAYYAHIPHGDYIVLSMEVVTMRSNHEVRVYRSDGELIQRLKKTRPGSFFYPEPPDEDDIDWDHYNLYDVSLTNPDDTELDMYVDLFGYWEADGSYRMTDSGFRAQDDLLCGNGGTLTLLQDFTVTRRDPDNWLDETDEEITIPEGTEVDLIATDPDMTTAFFRVSDDAELTDDGEKFIFALSYDDNDDNFGKIDGVDEADLFDGIKYRE